MVDGRGFLYIEIENGVARVFLAEKPFFMVHSGTLIN
jgi:hypothetical protein